MNDVRSTSARLLTSCRAAGVGDVLLDRAEQLRTADGFDANADRFLELLVALAGAAPLPWPPPDLGPILVDDVARAAMIELIDRHATPHDASADERQMLRFLVEGRSTGDPDVAHMIHEWIRRALDGRGSPAQSRIKHFDHQDARAALLGARRVFEQHGKRFFLDRGTLLGAIREQGFIASDYDIDVGIFDDEITLEELKAMFENTDYALSQDEDFKVGLLSPGGIQIDFFLTLRRPGYLLSKGFGGYHNWYFSPFELMEYPFLDATFLVPATYEKHLDENYGNWRSPAIFYDLSYNEPCVAYGRTASACNYQARRLRNALNTGESYLARAASRVLAEHYGFDYTDSFPDREAGWIAPEQPTNRRSEPIVIVDDFDVYSHRVRRAIESALSLTADVDLGVLAESPNDAGRAPEADRRAVAASVDRIRHVIPFDLTDASGMRGPVDGAVQAIVVGPGQEHHLGRLREAARGTTCSIVLFDGDSVALDRDADGRVFARQDASTPPSHT